MVVTLNTDILQRLELEAQSLNITISERVNEILDQSLPPIENFDEGRLQSGIESIKGLLERIPGITFVSISKNEAPYWWVKFGINLHSKISWIIVQELGHILNYLSVDDKLPVRFYPVSPPPYLNGGPDEYLSWVIEPMIPFVDTISIFEYLVGRLPKDLDHENSWLLSGE